MTSRPSTAFTIAGVCALIALLVIPLVSPEEGAVADVLWLTQMLAALAGLAAIVVGLVALRRARS